jgi:hypothetical protein
MDCGSTFTVFSRLGSNWLPFVPFSCPSFARKKFEDEHELKNFFSQKSQDFYKRGILSLPERSRQVIDSNGAFIIET